MHSQPDIEGPAGLMSQLQQQAEASPCHPLQQSLGRTADGLNPLGHLGARQNHVGQNHLAQNQFGPPSFDRRQGAASGNVPPHGQRQLPGECSGMDLSCDSQRLKRAALVPDRNVVLLVPASDLGRLP